MKLSLVLVVLSVLKFSKAVVTEETKSAVATSNNEFALDLLKKLHSDGTNVFFSPLSISAAVAMTSLGARGNTLDEINSVFHFNDVAETSTDSMALHEALKELIANYKERIQFLGLANRLFPRKDLDLIPKFSDDVKNYYKVSIEKVDFNSSEAENIINQWVSQRTNNKINDLFAPGSIGPDALLVLVNAIYFKDFWKNKFSRTDSLSRSFHVNSHETEMPLMMVQTYEFNYANDDQLNVQILEMAYKESNISMFAILPELGKLNELISKLTAQKLKDLINSMSNTEVRVHFPKFTIETKYALEETLTQLGINDLFTNSANLTGITEVPSKVSKIVHKALIRVNEEETEAAAATGIEIYPMSLPHYPPVDIPEFIADHPFLIFLMDKSNNDIILFAGAVNRPGQ